MYTLDTPPILFRESPDINKVVTTPNMLTITASYTTLSDIMEAGTIGVWISLLTTNAKTYMKLVQKNKNISFYIMLR
jgi:hypothetical protein